MCFRKLFTAAAVYPAPTSGLGAAAVADVVARGCSCAIQCIHALRRIEQCSARKRAELIA